MASRSPFIRFLRLLSYLIPTDYLKTFFFLNFIYKPREFVYALIHAFYRFEFIYTVLKQVRCDYSGRFSILEFGTASGYSFAKILYATKYLKMDSIVTVHAFDTFEGLPAPKDEKDKDHIDGDEWGEGEFVGNYEKIYDYVSSRHKNFLMHKGLFEKTLSDDLVCRLKKELPIVIFFDCDYYSSAESIFRKIIDIIPNGCVLYFDDIDFNYRSRFTGESRVIHEINEGKFGKDIELIPDFDLSKTSQRIYRFFRLNNTIQYNRNYITKHGVREVTNGSPLP